MKLLTPDLLVSSCGGSLRQDSPYANRRATINEIGLLKKGNLLRISPSADIELDLPDLRFSGWCLPILLRTKVSNLGRNPRKMGIGLEGFWSSPRARSLNVRPHLATRFFEPCDIANMRVDREQRELCCSLYRRHGLRFC